MSLPSPSHHSRLSEPLFEFPESYSKFPLAIYFTHGIVSFHVTLSMQLPLPLLPFPHVDRSVLYVCFPIAALKINSSVPPFKFVISSQKKVCDYLRLRFNVAFLSVMINCSLENLDPKGGLFFNANIPTAGTVNGKRKLPDNGVKIQ